jgi:hypothetical protein
MTSVAEGSLVASEASGMVEPSEGEASGMVGGASGMVEPSEGEASGMVGGASGMLGGVVTPAGSGGSLAIASGEP